MEVEYCTYSHDLDYFGQRKLFKVSFPEANNTSMESDAHYRWKFSDFPAAVPSYQYVGRDGDELVGYYAALPFRYVIDGVSHTCGMVCDVMTHPEHRGKGIFTKIGRHSIAAMRAEGLGFTMGYPIRPEVIPGHLKVGWIIVQQMPVYVRPIGVRSFLPIALQPLAPIANVVLRALQSWTLIRTAGYTTEILTREAFVSGLSVSLEYNSFLSSWMAQQDNALVKDSAFLRWRTAAPGTEYYFLPLRFNDHLVGLAIARPTRLKEIETLAVLDFMILNSHLAGGRTLHSGLKQLAQDKGTDLVACMTSAKWAKTYGFAGSCYIRTAAVFSLIVRKLQSEIRDENLYDSSHWHVFWIDSDDL